ncbi:MAG: reverse transcriptase domain-containing protein [Pseudomonas sp.]
MASSWIYRPRSFVRNGGRNPVRVIISPILANWTLDGLEHAAKTSVASTDRRRQPLKLHVIRYADDFIVTGATKALLQHQVRRAIEVFLKERGLELSDEKTHITHISEGFDFLGQLSAHTSSK